MTLLKLHSCTFEGPACSSCVFKQGKNGSNFILHYCTLLAAFVLKNAKMAVMASSYKSGF